MSNLEGILKGRDITLLTTVLLVKAIVFSVVMYGFESWTVKEAEHQRTDAWTVVLKTIESPLDCKEIQPFHPKGNQSWIFIGRTDVEAETPILWPPDAKNRLIGKDPDAGKDWRQEETETTVGEMVGWHHWLNDRSLIKLQELDREAWHAAVHRVTKNQTRLILNWETELSDWRGL